jgi:hypothetical protein
MEIEEDKGNAEMYVTTWSFQRAEGACLQEVQE